MVSMQQRAVIAVLINIRPITQQLLAQKTQKDIHGLVGIHCGMRLDQAVVHHGLIVGVTAGRIGTLYIQSHLHPAAPPFPVDQRVLQHQRLLQDGMAVTPFVKFIFLEAFVCAEGADLRNPLQDLIAFFPAIPVLFSYLELLPRKTIHVKQLIGIAVGHTHRLVKILKIFPWRLHFSYPFPPMPSLSPGAAQALNPKRQAGVPHRLPFRDLHARMPGGAFMSQLLCLTWAAKRLSSIRIWLTRIATTPLNLPSVAMVGPFCLISSTAAESFCL